MGHPYSGPASLECVNENTASDRFHRRPAYNFSLPSGLGSPAAYSHSLHGAPSIISVSSSPTSDQTLSPIVEESSFFYDREYDSDATTTTVRSRRLKKRSRRTPRSARSDISEFSNITKISNTSTADTYRSGWTSSLMFDDASFSNCLDDDPYTPQWKRVIRRHLRRFRAFLSGSSSGIQWTSARPAALSVR